jgi:hypothetical protein
MDDIPMVAAKATNDTQGFRFRIAKRTSESTGREIGGMWFTETQPTLHETCRAIFEEGAQPQKTYDIVMLLYGKMPIGAEASVSRSHGFANQSFLPYPYEVDSLMQIGRALSAGHAHLRRSRIEVSLDDPENLWGVNRKLKESRAGLSEEDRSVLDTLGMRRGRVGEPLEMFWQAASRIGLARDAEVVRRHYGSGFIPKLKIDDHLFQIERAPLFEQIRQVMDANCSGLVWIVDDYVRDEVVHLEFEALTFDQEKAMKKFMKAREEASATVWSFLK